ncbi:MAG: sensor histidine kinase [Myxococcaceae bacterium]
MMTPHWVSVVTCAGELAFAMLAIVRGSRSPLAMPLALFSLNLFTWNFAALAYAVSGVPAWHWLDQSTSPLSTPFALHFLFIFIGRRRQLRWVLFASYAAFGALGASSFLAFFFSWARAFAATRWWAILHVAFLLPTMTLVLVLLFVHLHRTQSLAEQTRTRLFISALAIIVAFAFTELLADLGFEVLRLGNVGSLVATAILAVIALRFDLFERELSAMFLVYALVVACVAVLAYLGLFQFLRTNIALLVVGVATVTLALVAITRSAGVAQTARRERLEQLATLGRFSAQMAHDIKNPLAALKGAAQFLREEQAQGRSLADKGEFLGLILEQINRVQTVVDEYQRLGRVEPMRVPLQINEVVQSVLSLQRFAGANVAVKPELATGLPELRVDRDLVAGAIENLARNALEAMPLGGTLTVRTARALAADTDGITVEVEDTGKGMDARTRERAFDDFFTTKSSGSGLGLAFVRRVVEAHGGEVSLTSKEGRGTVVRLRLPVAA